jgi:hypothetical protein
VASSAGRAKRDREKARQERQQAKRDRKQAAQSAPAEPERLGVRRDHDQVLADLAALHQRFADEAIDFDEFEETKAGLLAELEV